MKKLIAVFAIMGLVWCAVSQEAYVTPKTITRVGTTLAIGNAYFSVLNSETGSASYVTIVSDDTNLFTVGTATATITTSGSQVTVTFDTDLSAGNYSGTITVSQTNAPTSTLVIPVSLRVTEDTGLPLGSLADTRVLPGNIGATPAVPPRRYGDILVGTVTITDQGGTDHDYMNLWIASDNVDTDDWESLGAQIYAAVVLAAQQRDTNDATDATAYTPRYIGDTLTGQDGSGTGVLWIATGLTTDDWTVLVPASSVWGEAGIVESTNLLVNTVAIQAKDIVGNDLAGERALRIWISETDIGAASTNNIETLVMSTGVEISEETANADYIYATASDGSAVATVTATAAGTNYLMVADGSVINSAPLTFE